MYLKILIETLESLPPNGVITHGFGKPNSYRGYYDQLAFEPAHNVTVEEMLRHATFALGRTFEGYKGGEFTMEEYSICNIAMYGRCDIGGGDAITESLVKYWRDDCRKENAQ